MESQAGCAPPDWCSPAQWRGLVRYRQTFRQRMAERTAQHPECPEVHGTMSEPWPSLASWVIPGLARRWHREWPTGEYPRITEDLAAWFSNPWDRLAVWRYSQGFRHLASPGAQMAAEARRDAFRQDPQGRFSVRFATFEEWARALAVIPTGDDTEPPVATGTIRLARYQAMSRYHFLDPGATLYDLQAQCALDLRAGGVDTLEFDVSAFSVWLSDATPVPRREALRDWVQRQYPHTPYWWIDDHLDALVAAYRTALMEAITREEIRVWGRGTGVLPSDHPGNVAAYGWLAAEYGISEDEDAWWLIISEVFDHVAVAPHDLDPQDWERLADEDGILRFLEDLLRRYRAGTTRYPGHREALDPHH